jgi:pyruvate dehydrogenase E2 component (dihydrolipoamide acetyltransferase)
MSRLRRTIARRLTESIRSAPHFSVTVAVDMTAAVALRGELKARGIDVSVTDLVLWATAAALAEFPVVNGRTDGERVWERDRVHLGMAVAVPGGLLVPVIRDADRMTLAEIHAASSSLADSARVGRLGPDELTGSTFTVTNLGMLDIEQFDPIINPGESGILSVASIIPTPAAVGEGIAVRGLMRITLAADHRLVDGELGARFINAIRRRLEDATAIRSAAPVQASQRRD